jgi:hypothetical protein
MSRQSGVGHPGQSQYYRRLGNRLYIRQLIFGQVLAEVWHIYDPAAKGQHHHQSGHQDCTLTLRAIEEISQLISVKGTNDPRAIAR